MGEFKISGSLSQTTLTGEVKSLAPRITGEAALGLPPAGVTAYPDLTDKPKVNRVELVGDKSLDELGIEPKKGVDEFYVSKGEKDGLDKVIVDLNYDITANNIVSLDISSSKTGRLLSTYNIRRVSFYIYVETNATTTGKRLGISVNNTLTTTYKQTTSAAAYILGRIGASGYYRVDLSTVGGILYFRLVGSQSSTKVVDSTSVAIGAIDGINPSISTIESVQFFVLAPESTFFNGKIKILGIYE